MKKLARIAFMAFISLTLVSCEELINILTSTDFSNQKEVGIYDQTNALLGYDPDVHQLVTSSSKNTFRIQSDDQSEYVHMDLSTNKFSLGAMVSVTINASGVSGVSSGNYTMEVLKKGTNVWLWDEDESIGVIIPSDL